MKTEAHDLDEYFIDLPPELCELKILGFSKEIGSSLSLLPSFMHRLENFLVAVQLKDWLASSFPEGAEVTASRVLLKVLQYSFYSWIKHSTICLWEFFAKLIYSNENNNNFFTVKINFIKY